MLGPKSGIDDVYILLPAMLLTKIWIVSSASEWVEESEEMEFERLD